MTMIVMLTKILNIKPNVNPSNLELYSSVDELEIIPRIFSKKGGCITKIIPTKLNPIEINNLAEIGSFKIIPARIAVHIGAV